MSKYEARRLENIKRNEALVKDLGLQEDIAAKDEAGRKSASRKRPAAKRRKLHASQPTRTSARIASASIQPVYNDDNDDQEDPSLSKRKSRKSTPVLKSPNSPQPALTQDLEALIASWSTWTSTEPAPTRDVEGNYHFQSHPLFTPNKSPEAIIREGSFGGTYWRPLYSRRLGATISEDWRELPGSWTSGLDAQKYLANEVYDPEINKYGVSCGQSIEEWEAAGWIAHAYDVRGWFQWYCRFWLGRRCADDDRQISRWRKCVGETGRWRRTLLKKYVQMGIRSVTDEGDEDEDEEYKGDVSPVVHQTCHHWAWEVRQEALDRFWAEGK